MIKPLISVIVPIYDVEKYVEKCIESIINQTYTNLEIILIDDGSIDSSGKICDFYANIDERVSVIHKKNSGLSEARNTGIKIAKGELLAFVDGDDYIAEDMYDILYGVYVKYKADIVVCGFYKVDEESNILSVVNDNKEIIVLNSEDAVSEIVYDKNINSFVWNKLFVRKLFNEIEFPYGRYVQDVAVMYKLFMKADKVVQVNEAKCYYVQRKDSIQNTRSRKCDWDQFCIYLERKNYLKDIYPKLKKKLLYDIIHFGIVTYRRFTCEYSELSDLEKEQLIYIREILVSETKDSWNYISVRLKCHLIMIKHIKFIYDRYFMRKRKYYKYWKGK